MPRRGDCVCFADPAKSAQSTEIFWLADDCRDSVSAYVREASDPGLGSVISLGETSCSKALLKTSSGKQFILLRAPHDSMQIQCVGDDIRAQPFSIEIVIGSFPDIKNVQTTIKRTADVYSYTKSSEKDRGWTVEAMRHRDAIAAHDLQLRGKNYQDIARFLFGDRLVDEDWSNPNRTLKNRTIRSCKRAARMIDGDYRMLLK